MSIAMVVMAAFVSFLSSLWAGAAAVSGRDDTPGGEVMLILSILCAAAAIGFAFAAGYTAATP